MKPMELHVATTRTTKNCTFIKYNFKTCTNSEFVYEIYEECSWVLKKKTCLERDEFMISFQFLGTKEILKVPGVIFSPPGFAKGSIFVRFQLDKVLSTLYGCIYPVDDFVYLELEVSENELKWPSSTEHNYKAGHRTVIKEWDKYRPFEFADYDKFFNACYYESKKYVYGVMACFGVGVFYLTLLILYRRISLNTH